MSLYLTILPKWQIKEKYFLYFQGTSLEFADLEKEQNVTSSNTLTNRTSTLPSSVQPINTTSSPVLEMASKLENKTVLSSTLTANNGSTVHLTNGTKPASTTESMRQTMSMSEVEENKVTLDVEMNKTSITINKNILKSEPLGFSCPVCPTAPTCPICESSCSATPTTPIPTAAKIEPGKLLLLVYVLIS